MFSNSTSISSAYQDRYVLKKAYDQITRWNMNMKIDNSLEKYAQSQGCVKYHKDHTSGSEAGARGHAITCSGGCKYGSGWPFDKNKPVQNFFNHRKGNDGGNDETPHFTEIMKYNRVGCSAVKEGNTYCVYCVLKPGGSVPLGRPAKPSGTISGDCQYDCDGWPYAQCQMFVSNKYGSSSATCINPFPPGSRTKYSNYPECADIPSGCQRCDDYCAQRDGKTSRNSY